jgi:hypothetical protein
MKLKPLPFLSIILFSFLVFLGAEKYFSRTNDKYFQVQKQSYRIFQPYIPDSISIFGEPVPIENIMVREKLEKEVLAVMYWHSRTILVLKRSHRFFPWIESILKEENIPSDFKYLAIAESELSTVVSPAGATGYWQFLKSTGKLYGLTINEYVDERNHILKSTRAACKYLRHLKDSLGSYTLAAAAYNAGPQRISSAISMQKNKNYFFLSFNEETSRYVYRIMAYKLICESPTTYGFFLRNKDLYQPWQGKWIQIDTAINNLIEWANQFHLSYAELIYFNPWIKDYTLPKPDKNPYLFFIPSQKEYSFYIKELKNPNQIAGDTITL